MSEICLGHLTKCCRDCTPDNKNKQCPHYHKVNLSVIEVEVKNDRDISKPAPVQCVQEN